MSGTVAPTWEKKRTDQSRLVESRFRDAGFKEVSAYRYNSASIRVRLIDDRFRGLSMEERDKLVEPVLDSLPGEIQEDIVNIVLIHPGEAKESFRAFRLNEEFEKGESSL